MGKSYNLSVYLLKEGKAIDNIIDDDFKTLAIDKDSIKGYLLNKKSNSPFWVGYLGINPTDFNIANTSNSFVLFVSVDNRVFAYTFGFAYTKLKADDIVENFGFMVTINSLDGEKLKSIDTYSPSNNTKQRKIVSSVLAKIYDYSFNDQLDIVQRLSGLVKSEFSDLFKNSTGIDCLKISTKKAPEELIDLSKILLERYNSDDYLKDDNLKNINKIKKAPINILPQLDNILLKNINNNEGIFLTDFEIIAYEELYKYKFKKNSFYNLDFKKIIPFMTANDIDALKKEKIQIYKDDDSFYKEWSLYKCLAADFVLEDKHYFLAKGQWYQIEKGFLTEIKNVEEYFIKDHELPKFKGTKEDAYNADVVNSNPDKYYLFDRKLVNIDGRGTIEICDIYDKENNIFYHIKQENHSSNLSHLWQQGLVSEQIANSKNEKYINKFNEICSDGLNDDRKIYYGIISKPNLPIFSKISLYNTLNSFKQMKKEKKSVGYFFIEKAIADE